MRFMWTRNGDLAVTPALATAKRRDHLRRFGIEMRQHVRVDIESEGRGGMPQPPRDDGRIDALGRGEAGVGCPLLWFQQKGECLRLCGIVAARLPATPAGQVAAYSSDVM